MRIRKILLILILFLIFMPNIKAAKNVFTCVYTKGSNEITVKMDTEYKFDVTTNFLSEETECTVDEVYKSRTCTAPVENNLQFNNFVKDDGSFFCPNEIYLNEFIFTSASRNGGSVTTTYTVSREKQEEKTESTANSGGATSSRWLETKEIYALNEEKSSVKIESTSESNAEENWLKTCNYNEIILRFNKTTYEFVSTGNYNEGTIPGHQEDLMELLKDNEYACPVSLCINGYGSHGYTVTDFDYYFDNSKAGDKSCITGAEYTDAEYSCVGVNQYFKDFITYHNQYQSTKSMADLNLRNESQEKLSVFCNSALDNLNYDDENNCVKECLNVEKIIEDKLETKINGECGFSGRLMSWISNILRWIKYILPVIVIVFGILDFIKAIAGDKDDEMKKVQGRFIKRLIAAALVFIIPLIIEFVLDKMGFGYDDCGLF